MGVFALPEPTTPPTEDPSPILLLWEGNRNLPPFLTFLLMRNIVVIGVMVLLPLRPLMLPMAHLMDLDLATVMALDLATVMAMVKLMAILVVVPLMGLQMAGTNTATVMPFPVLHLSHVVFLKTVAMPTFSGILALPATGLTGPSPPIPC